MGKDSDAGGTENLASRFGRSSMPDLLARKSVRQKDLFDFHPKQCRNLEGQGQAGIVSSSFNCVHRLPRHIQLLGQIGLRQIPFRPQHSQSIFH